LPHFKRKKARAQRCFHQTCRHQKWDEVELFPPLITLQKKAPEGACEFGEGEKL